MVISFKWEDRIFGFRRIIFYIWTTANISFVAGQIGFISIFVPCCDRVTIQASCILSIHTRNVDQVVHALFFIKLKDELFAFPPSACSPVSSIIIIRYKLKIKSVWILGCIYVCRECHLDGCDLVIGDSAQFWQFWSLYLDLFRCSGSDQRTWTFTNIIDCRYIYIVADIIFQSAQSIACCGDLCIHLGIDSIWIAALFIIHTIAQGIICFSPGNAQCLILWSNFQIIRCAWYFIWLWSCCHFTGQLSGPAIFGISCNRKVVFGQIFQSFDGSFRYRNFKLSGVVARRGSVFYQITIYVIHCFPAQLNLFCSCSCFEVCWNRVGDFYIIRNDIF